jgi:mycothiol synthase
MKVRPATKGDFEPIVRMFARDEELLLGRPSRITATDLRTWLAAVDLDRSTWLYDDDGAVAAFGWTQKDGDVNFAVGVVAPSHKGRGIGDELVTRSERRGGEEGSARMHQIAFAADAAADSLLRRRDYGEVRRFFEMAIQLEAEPDVPGGVPIETFQETDARAFHDALDEAFADHWEHHPHSFDEWWERHQSSGNYDPSLWFLVRDGDEIVGVCRNEANRNGGGYVGAIGVRRPWRGRGIARALLLHTFAEFYRRGIPRVTLGVDAQNPTGATKLYESVGMAPEQESVVYEKALA